MVNVPDHAPALPMRLTPGDRVGIVAPSGSFEERAFLRGVDIIREMGFMPVVPESLFREDRYLAGDDRHRAGLIHRMFADDDIRGIFSARGGYGAMRLLLHLDWEAIGRHPKIFVGFSDVSVLLTALNARCGMVTFHGPVLTSLGDADPETRASLKAALSSAEPLVHRPQRPVVVRPGMARGPVVGGNLCTLCHLAGTAFAPETSGRILFLEDCGEPPYKIDRMLTHLKLCGWFEAPAGVVFGSFERCGDLVMIGRIIEEIFADAPFPVMGGFEIGHGVRNLVLPVGLEAVLDTHRGVLACTGPATSGPGGAAAS